MATFDSYRFDGFRLVAEQRRLYGPDDQTYQEISGKALDLLLYLVTQPPDKVVTNEELRKALWPHVTRFLPNTAAKQFTPLYRLLGDQDDNNRVYIQRDKVGTRFLKPVSREPFVPPVEPVAPPLPAPEPSEELRGSTLRTDTSGPQNTEDCAGAPSDWLTDRKGAEKKPDVFRVPIFRKPFFVGRDTILSQLAARFVGHDRQIVQILTGMGGAGKTRAAAEYCYAAISNYSVIWWIDASEERLIEHGLRALSEELGLAKSEDHLSWDEIAPGIAARLRGVDRWLLVLDNADIPTRVERYLADLAMGHVIVTSRNPSWRECGLPVEVRPLNREDSIIFLIHRSGNLDREAAGSLSEALGDLPIALEQAAAFVERTASGLDSYLKRYIQRRLRYDKFDDDGERAMAAIWSITIRRLNRENPVAVALARLLSFFGPYRIPIQFLVSRWSSKPSPLVRALLGLMRWISRINTNDNWTQRPKGLNECFSLEAALELLRQYAIVEVTQDDVSIHPVVQSVIQSETRPRFRTGAINYCAQIISENLTDVHRVTERTRLGYLHGLEVIRHAESASVISVALIDILIKASDISAAIGSLCETPVQLLQRALRLAQGLPTDQRVHWEIQCLVGLVHACNAASRYSEAVGYLWEALKVRVASKTSAPQPIVAILSAYGDLLVADWETSYAGRFYEAAIMVERGLGQSSLSLATLLSDYAEVLIEAGELERAREVANEGLAMAATIAGTSHPIVARHHYRLARIQAFSGNWPAGRRSMEFAVSTIRDAVGEESTYFRQMRRELDLLTAGSQGRGFSHLFRHPREPVNEPTDRSYPIGEMVVAAYTAASSIAIETLRRSIYRTLSVSCLGSVSPTSQTATIAEMIGGMSQQEGLGEVLSPVITSAYRDIASASEWMQDQEVLAVFRDEVLDQYARAFRQKMALYVPTDRLDLEEVPDTFEGWISFFEAYSIGFFKHVPSCFVRAERALVGGSVAGNPCGIYGIALRSDAAYYLEGLLQVVQAKRAASG